MNDKTQKMLANANTLIPALVENAIAVAAHEVNSNVSI